MISASDFGWDIEVISARAFISMNASSKEYREIITKTDLFWITSTPQNQIQALRKLQNIQTKVILEKPVATEQSEIIALRDLLNNSQCKVYLSQPWTFSSLWEETKRVLLPLQGEIKIQAIRGGNLSRIGFSPEIDWAPHDLYLLVDYIKSSGKESWDGYSVSGELINRNITLRYNFGMNLTFEITAGYRDTRQAQWEVHLDGEPVLTLDFETLELTDHRNANPRKFVAHINSPLESMLSAAFQEGPNVDWHLVLKLYEDLLGGS